MLINGNLRTNIVPLGTMTMGRFGINRGKKKKKDPKHPQMFHELMIIDGWDSKHQFMIFMWVVYDCL
jgi:hypothetical protein